MSLALLAIAGTIGAVLLLARHEGALAREWRDALSGAELAALDILRYQYAAERSIDDLNHERAQHEDGFLRLAEEYLIDGAADRLGLLQRLTRFSAIVDGIFGPISPAPLEVGRTRLLARAGALLHHLLLETSWQWRLRLWMLHAGFVGSLRAYRKGANAAPSVDWELLERGRADYWSLSEETLESARVLLVSVRRFGDEPARARR